MLKHLMMSLLSGLWQMSNPAPAPVLLKQFVQEVMANKLDEPALADKYMCTSLLQRTDEKGDKVRTLFHMTLTSYREVLHKQHIDPQALVIIPFAELRTKPIEIIGDTQHVYVAQYKGEICGYFLMQESKIDSFTLLDKGERGFFLSYCE